MRVLSARIVSQDSAEEVARVDAGARGDGGVVVEQPERQLTVGAREQHPLGVGLEFAKAYNSSWFAKEPTGHWFLPGKPVKFTPGYQAPPLDGVWATAPYFHNASVPTLYAVLNSRARPRIFTRSFRTAEEDFDRAFATIEPRLRESLDVIVYCAGFGCEASHIVARKLKDRGIPAAILHEGWPAWQDAGYPVKPGRQP